MVETWIRNPVHKMDKVGAALVEGDVKTETRMHSL